MTRMTVDQKTQAKETGSFLLRHFFGPKAILGNFCFFIGAIGVGLSYSFYAKGLFLISKESIVLIGIISAVILFVGIYCMATAGRPKRS